jgi:hypothetical protein
MPHSTAVGAVRYVSRCRLSVESSSPGCDPSRFARPVVGQVLAHGGTDDDIGRLVRRRRWSIVHRGVHVDHTGPLTWDQRAWAAVLRHAPTMPRPC